jgi:hypothetical protein
MVWSAELRNCRGRALFGQRNVFALAPADFNKVSVPVTALREANVDDQASTYCVYDSKNGKVELDIFYPAGDSPESAKGIEKTVLAQVGSKFESITLPGVDSATINLAVAGKIPSASICVRKNVAVFILNIPQSPQSRPGEFHHRASQARTSNYFVSYPSGVRESPANTRR